MVGQALPEAIRRARRLRRTMTLPEVMLWQDLRARPGGFRFRRQHPLASYILDFLCVEARLAVEIDGATHQSQARAAFDVHRDQTLAARGITTLRIPAADVLRDRPGVISRIISAAQAAAPLHRSAVPLPLAGEDKESHP